MNAKEIIEKHLKENGYDGLYSENCGCQISNLMPCCIGEEMFDCEAGYKIPCNPNTCLANGDCEWHIGPRPESEDK